MEDNKNNTEEENLINNILNDQNKLNSDENNSKFSDLINISTERLRNNVEENSSDEEKTIETNSELSNDDKICSDEEKTNKEESNNKTKKNRKNKFRNPKG